MAKSVNVTAEHTEQGLAAAWVEPVDVLGVDGAHGLIVEFVLLEST